MKRVVSGWAVWIAVFTIFAAGCVVQKPDPAAKLWPCTQPVLGGAVEYKLDGWADLLTIPVVWRGKPACFVVDTGTSINVLDPTAFTDLHWMGDSTHAYTPGGSHKKLLLFDPPDVTIGPFNLARCGPVAAFDMSDLRAVSDLPIIGLIGLASMENCVLQIDFERHQFRFLPGDQRAHPEWGTSIPIHLGSPPISVVWWSLKGADCGGFVLDSGDEDTLSVPAYLFDYFHSRFPGPVRTTSSVTMDGFLKFREMRATTLKFAGMSYQDVIIDEHNWWPAVGLAFFERHLTTIDFPNHRLYLKPGKEFSHHDRSGMCGLICLRQGTDWVIYEVENDGAASNTGLLKGDVVVAVNGTSVASKTRDEFCDLLQGNEGAEITVTVRRGTATKTVRIKLHSAI